MWLNRSVRLEYSDAGGLAVDTSGVLLYTFAAGPVLNVRSARVLISWNRLALLELCEDA